MLISWSRLLAGKYRDPLVGRDLLIGIVTAAALVIPTGIIVFCHKVFGTLLAKPRIPGLPLFSGSNAIVAGIMYFIAISILLGLVSVFIVFILRIALRKTWAVAIVLVLLASVVLYPTTPSTVGFTLTLIFFGLALFVCFRFGLVSMIAFFIYILIFSNFPILPLVSDWYFKIGLTGLVLLLAFTFYAFRTSLGGHPMFGTPRLDE